LAPARCLAGASDLVFVLVRAQQGAPLVVAPDGLPAPRPAIRSRSAGTAIYLDIGPIARPEISALCERVRLLLATSGADRLVCDVGTIVEPDAGTVDALARVLLTARRLGRQVRLRHASPELRELLGFCGLSGVMPLSRASRLEAGRQAEERKQVRSAQEERDPADPPA
jgi:ABC-type transporter Mla MlaB component